MTRACNFSAGPAALPEEVLIQAQSELLDWSHTGASVMELSHRGRDFMALAAESEQDLRDLMGIPSSYRVLFLQGGATQHFAQIPMNLAAPDQVADYIVTGAWGEKAVREAKPYVQARIAATSVDKHYTRIPPRASWYARSEARAMSTTRRTRPFMASSSRRFPMSATCRWLPTCPRTSCRGRWTSRGSA